MKLLLLLLVGLVAAEKVRYDGYQVYEVVPQTVRQLDELVKMQNWPEMDFWIAPGALGHPCHLMIPPRKIQTILKQFHLLGMKYSLIDGNVQTSLEVEENRLAQRPDLHIYDYTDYNPFAEFYPEMENLAAACPAGFTCETYSIGTSYEGVDMRVLRINSGSKPGIWMDSQVHAREWLTGSTLMLIADKMVRQYGIDAEATSLMDNYNWMIAPVMNPDGFIYTWTTDRLWRKTRSPNAGSSCLGTDMNRNWDDHWGGAGSSADPCSDTFRGTSPESEIETQNIANEIRRLYPTAGCTAFVSMHAYGNMWLHPFGWTCTDSPDEAEMNRVANIVADAIQATSGTTWTRGSICDTIYEASGGTIDWIYSGGGITYAYSPEMRGTRFDPPKFQITPSFNEMWNGIVAMCAEI